MKNFIVTKLAKKKELIFIILLTCLGAFLRFNRLADQEFWKDEAFTGIIVKKSWAKAWNLTLNDTHPPLYNMLLKAWGELFGYTDFALRSLSVVLGTLTIPLVFYLVKKLQNLSRLTPYFAAIIVTANPFLVYYSQESRSYALLGLVTVLTTLALYQALTQPKLQLSKNWLALSFLLTLGIFTHYIFFFTVLGVGLTICSYWLANHQLQLKNLKHLALITIETSFLPLLSFALWWPLFKTQTNVAKDTTAWIQPVNFSYLIRDAYIAFFGFNQHWARILPITEPFAIIILLLIFSLIIYTLIKTKNRLALLFSFVMSIVPILAIIIVSLYFGKHLFLERYLIGFNIFLLIFIITIIAETEKKLLIYPLVGFYLLIACNSLFNPQAGADKAQQNLGYRELNNYIKNSNKTFVFADPFEFTIAKYYLDKEFWPKIKVFDYRQGLWYGTWLLIDDVDCVNPWTMNNYLVVNYDPFNRGEAIRIKEFKLYEQ